MLTSIFNNASIYQQETENKLYTDYDDDLYQRMYIEIREEKRSMFKRVQNGPATFKPNGDGGSSFLLCLLFLYSTTF